MLGVVRYQWDLDGNGSYDTEGISASTSYPTAGNRVVRLKVTDSNGEFSLQAKSFAVVGTDEQPPTNAGGAGGGLISGGTLNNGGGRTAGGSNTGGGGGTKVVKPVKWSFNTDLTAKRQQGAKVLKSGVRIAVNATKAGSVTVTLTLGSKKLGSRKVSVKAAGRTYGYVKLTTTGKKLLKKRPAKVKASGRGTAGGSDTVTVTVSR